MGCARPLRDASLSWVHNARDCGDYWPRQLERKKRLAFVSDEKRLNSQHPLSNFACSLTILEKNIANQSAI